MTRDTFVPPDGALDPRAPFDGELALRLERAWLVARRDPTAWPFVPEAAPDRAAWRRAELFAALLRRERVHGPPSRSEMLARLEFESRADPRRPAWLHLPWYVPVEDALAIDAYFESVFGIGYTALGMGRDGEYALGKPSPGPVSALVKPVPGALPSDIGRDGRYEVGRRASAFLAGLGYLDSHVTVWNDTEPADAYLGMMCGQVLREGHVRLGISRRYSDPADWDDF